MSKFLYIQALLTFTYVPLVITKKYRMFMEHERQNNVSVSNQYPCRVQTCKSMCRKLSLYERNIVGLHDVKQSGSVRFLKL